MIGNLTRLIHTLLYVMTIHISVDTQTIPDACYKIYLYPVSSCVPSLFRCPCMAITVSLQYNGGFLPGIMLLIRCHYHRGTRLYAMKRGFVLRPMFPPKRFDNFSSCLGDAQKALDAFIFFFIRCIWGQYDIFFLCSLCRFIFL